MVPDSECTQASEIFYCRFGPLIVEKRQGGSMYGIGMQELLVILVIVVIIFGAKKLPEIGGGLGRAIRNFKRASSEPDEIDITPKDKKNDDTGPAA